LLVEKAAKVVTAVDQGIVATAKAENPTVVVNRAEKAAKVVTVVTVVATLAAARVVAQIAADQETQVPA
jgi:hypothetical protein